jgi:predicted MPP superfamily phosphohydrolase
MRVLSVTLTVALGLSLACGCQSAPVEPVVLTKGETGASKIGATFPNDKESLKFAVIGDFGSGSVGQYQTAARMAETHSTFPFEIVLTVGDNLYGSQRRQDFITKFEVPYKPLLDAKVKFYAALGNHDIRDQRNYEHFNMGGKLYYSYKAPRQDVKFFVLETTYPEPEQIKWLEEELRTSSEDWKIAYFHHPLYSSGARHGSDEQLRETLEPLFVKYGVSVVFTGHDHFYERTKPQQGITYFVAGSGGMLRPGGFRPDLPFSEKVNANTMVFMAVELKDDKMHFKAISREGTLIDEGEITRRTMPAAVGSPAVVVKEPVK